MDSIVRTCCTRIVAKILSQIERKVSAEDQFDRTINGLSGPSKLLATRADLTWAVHDLPWSVVANALQCGGERRCTYCAICISPLSALSAIQRWDLVSG